MLTFLDGLSRWTDRVLQALLAVMAVVMLIVNLAQITGRYVFFYSILWSEELSTYMFVCIIFLSLHMITREKVELTIEVFKGQNEQASVKMRILRDIVTIIAVGILLYASVVMIKNAMAFPRRTASLGISTWPLYLCMPVGFGLALLQKFTNLCHHIRELSGGKN